jgi:hypothetical protein
MIWWISPPPVPQKKVRCLEIISIILKVILAAIRGSNIITDKGQLRCNHDCTYVKRKKKKKKKKIPNVLRNIAGRKLYRHLLRMRDYFLVYFYRPFLVGVFSTCGDINE